MEILMMVIVGVVLWYGLSTVSTPAGRQRQARAVAEREQRQQRKINGRRVTGAKCPTCGGADIVRVGFGERAASGVVGGLVFSRKARAQVRCRSCNYYW